MRYRCSPVKDTVPWIAVMVLATGCSTPKHSNALIFATNTKFGIDISYDQKTQEPNLVVGYKRQEGVWMPLLANLGPDGLTPGVTEARRSPKKPPGTLASDKVAVTTASTTERVQPASMPVIGANGPDEAPVGTLFVGLEEKNGATKPNVDTYSVLASFGAKFSAKGASTSGAEAGGALAQYFATGLAARELAREGGSRLVSVQPADALAARAVVDAQIEKNRKESRQLTKTLDEKIDGLDAAGLQAALDCAKSSGLMEAATADKLKTTLSADATQQETVKKKLKGHTIAESDQRRKVTKAFAECLEEKVP